MLAHIEKYVKKHEIHSSYDRFALLPLCVGMIKAFFVLAVVIQGACVVSIAPR